MSEQINADDSSQVSSQAKNVRNFYYTKDYIYGKNIAIGEWTYGRPQVRFKREDTRLIIGKFCSIASGVQIFMGGDHIMENVSTYPFTVLKEFWLNAEGETIKPSQDVVIGNDVWIGTQSTIMPGITIGDGAVIAAHSVVTKNVEPYSIVAGNPARERKKRFDEEVITFLLETKWWDWDIEKIRKYVAVLSQPDIYQLRNCI